MKKIIGCFLIIVAGLASCKKETTPVFDKSPDDRINETLATYQSQLAGAQYGWKAIVKSDSGKGAAYSFYFKFSNDNRVIMYSDFDSTSAVTPKESSYRLKALQQPSLLFDTYSYLHLLSDPNENTVTVQADVNGFRGGTLGAGLKSDFEFAIDTATTDSIKLTGRFHGSKAVLVRATQAEATSFNNRGLYSGFLFQNLNKYLNYFKRITVGAVTYEITINQNLRTITFTWLDASGNVQTFSTGFYYTINGVEFANPLVNGSQTITGFTNVTWNATTTTLAFNVNGVATTVIGLGQPIKVDFGAPKRWYDYAVNNGNDYWISLKGFHVNGVDDAFNVKSLVSGANTYYYMIYWPKYAATYDFFGPVFLNGARTGLTLLYGTAPAPPTFTVDGRAIFVQLTNLGPHPTTGPAALSRTQLYNSSGYYFVQTGPLSYDMVSALDGKAWITWEW